MGLEPISKDDFCGEKILASREGVAEEGLGGRNFCPPSLSAAAEFRASETGAPPKLYHNNRSNFSSKVFRLEPQISFVGIAKLPSEI